MQIHKTTTKGFMIKSSQPNRLTSNVYCFLFRYTVKYKYPWQFPTGISFSTKMIQTELDKTQIQLITGDDRSFKLTSTKTITK